LVIAAGADKFSMNSAAVANPDLVREAAKQFGTEKVTVAVDARRNKDMPSGFELVVSGGTKPVGKDAISWAKECQDLGAGVILPTSMDGDGTQAGFDLEFARRKRCNLLGQRVPGHRGGCDPADQYGWRRNPGRLRFGIYKGGFRRC
jgi:imidazole glycerol phosphate synthase subunit HisF